MIRWLKILLTLFVAVFCGVYALQNIMNLPAGHGFVGLMTSMEGHVAYPNSIGPPITNPTLVWVMFWIIILGELTAAALALKGAWDLFRVRSADAATFNDMKTYALAAPLVGMLVWFGVFGAVGGAYFQMWQTEAGEGPFTHAGMFSIQMAALFLVIRARDH